MIRYYYEGGVGIGDVSREKPKRGFDVASIGVLLVSEQRPFFSIDLIICLFDLVLNYSYKIFNFGLNYFLHFINIYIMFRNRSNLKLSLSNLFYSPNENRKKTLLK